MLEDHCATFHFSGQEFRRDRDLALAALRQTGKALRHIRGALLAVPWSCISHDISTPSDLVSVPMHKCSVRVLTCQESELSLT